MLNNLLNSVTFYIILGLSISTLGFGYLSYSLSNDKAVAVYALKESKETIAGYEKSLNLKHLSCEIDSTSVVEVEAEKKQIDDSISPINTQLKELAIVKKSVTQSTHNKQENIKDESNFLPDDGLLSPNVTRLLTDGWCAVYPNTDECVPTEQPSGKSM